jgi:deoxyribodipyrimidine photo-lyase
VTAPLFADEDPFPPTPAAAEARLRAVRPAAYARSRNHLDGAVTRLSPYLTHGLLTLPQVLQQVQQQHGPLPREHKLVFELGWREYFRHVWAQRGDGIFDSLHAGPLPDAAYARTLPADLLQARTGVPAVDAAVRELQATGWLHNHARMWLASYMVHLRKLHWRSGADWMYGLLLDGDLASNHLSWQWVAGTGSHRPYLFNAENVARYAPPAWHSPGSVIDRDYAALDRIARSPEVVAAGDAGDAAHDPTPLDAGPTPGFNPPQAQAVQGRTLWIVHAWSLADPPATLSPDALRVGLLLAPWHARWPWSAKRWRFVTERMRALCNRPGDLLWWATPQTLHAALAAAAAVQARDDAHLQGLLAPWRPMPEPRLFEPVARPCSSFSQWWARTRLRDAARTA